MVAASGAVAHLACFDLPSHAAYTPILRHEQQLAGCCTAVSRCLRGLSRPNRGRRCPGAHGTGTRCRPLHVRGNTLQQCSGCRGGAPLPVIGRDRRATVGHESVRGHDADIGVFRSATCWIRRVLVRVQEGQYANPGGASQAPPGFAFVTAVTDSHSLYGCSHKWVLAQAARCRSSSTHDEQSSFVAMELRSAAVRASTGWVCGRTGRPPSCQFRIARPRRHDHRAMDW